LLGSGLALAGHGLDYARADDKGINWKKKKA
jgi:hypothetical protein